MVNKVMKWSVVKVNAEKEAFIVDIKIARQLKKSSAHHCFKHLFQKIFYTLTVSESLYFRW